eukprot:CAMPEP_0184283330 /NCGR_PEP_ID=MMETSP0977-20130417/65623_1 /TAXON_ID=483370 /ORGANISM="non described non described, Strain CCMP2097" /LENGTH=1056 /DNA_ID=CAMNT_0026589341 /DNA_START=54 /DNA_END=3221 /DNA_ORIENTATION=-
MSCFHQETSYAATHGSWDVMRAAGADLALLMGDVVYGDCKDAEGGCGELANAYALMDAIPAFSAFKAAQPMLATWDDHDYGLNNAGAEFPFKDVAKQLFLDFYDIPAEHEMRGRDGVYASYTFGPAGKRLQVIMLDARFFQTFNQEGAAGTMLGEEQWAWLEAEFQEAADLRLVVTSVQYLGNNFEGWYTMDCDQKRLLTILPDNVVLLSGDRHIGGFYQLDAYDGAEYAGWNSWFNGYLTPPLTLQPGQNAPLFEMTTSGLNTAITGGYAEPGPHRVPSMPMAREDHFGVLDINWDAHTVTATIVSAKTGKPLDGMVMTANIPAQAPPARRSLRFGYTSPEPEPAATCGYACTPWTGGAQTHLLESLSGAAFFPAGSFAPDPLLREVSTTVAAIFSGGEYTKLRQDSYWQVPANWLGKAFVSGPGDGQGVQHLGTVDKAKIVRIWQNNEIPAGRSTTLTYMVSAVEGKGGPGDDAVFPAADEMFAVHGAPLRYYDVALEHSGGKTTYEVVASGLGIKRIYVSDGIDTITLMTSSAAVVDALNGLQGPSRLCGGGYHIAHEFATEAAGAGFEDDLYMGGHEDGTFGALFVLDVATGGFYLLPLPRHAETATPIYSGSAEYVALVLNVYPESDGQHIHVYVGKKIAGSTDFLARNGLHPAHGRHYVISNDGGLSDWPALTAQETYAATFFPRSSTTATFFGTSSNKNEWSSVNKRGPHMWAQSLEGDRDIGIFSVDVAAGVLAAGANCASLGGSPLPCSMPATMKRLGIQELMDPDFEDPDSVYWSPRGYVLIAEDGSKGRFLRLDLDEAGLTTGNLTTLARISDPALVTDLNSVPPMTIPDYGVGQAEFTGILPHGFWHQLGPNSDAAAHLAREVEIVREQYVVNLQLHGHVEGIIGAMKLGQSTQLLRVDVDADAEGTAKAMYAWKGVGYYNNIRTGYCAANDCAGMRGAYVPGDVVLVSDFAILETWRGLAPGTYTNDLDAIVTESLGFSNFEEALPFAWKGVGYYNNIRTGYCAANDCAGMRGAYVPGDVVLLSDFAILETWRGLAPGTYTND